MRSWLDDEFGEAPTRRISQSDPLNGAYDQSHEEPGERSPNGLASPLETPPALHDPFFIMHAGAVFEAEDISAESIDAFESPDLAAPGASGSSSGPDTSPPANVSAIATGPAPSVDPSSFTMIDDADGVASSVEARAAHGGDGNRDGLADALQNDVASLRAAVGGGMVTVEAAGYDLRGVRALPASVELASKHALPLGLFAFEVHGVGRGGTAAVRLFLPEGSQADTYIKMDASGKFSHFDFDGSTGAVFDGNVVTLHLQDGGRGDADGLADSVITDPGGPGEVITAARIKEVTFSGLDRIPIEADPGTPSYPEGAQWVDTNANGLIDVTGDRALPIAYPRNTNVTIAAKFSVTTSYWPYTPPSYSLKVKATHTLNMPQPVYFSIPSTTVTLSEDGTELIMAPVTVVNPFPDYVNYGTLTLNWEFSNSGGAGWMNAGTSGNELYVTLDAPDVAPVFRSLLHISIPAGANAGIGNAASTALHAALVAAIWNCSFSGGNKATNANGVNLTYYKEWDSQAFTAAQLLASLDGRCTAFAELFYNSARAAGIPRTLFRAVTVIAAAPTEMMLIKNWQFIEPDVGSIPAVIQGIEYKYENRILNTYVDPTPNEGNGHYFQKTAGTWQYFWSATGPVEVRDQAGIAGQNTLNPKAHFSNHVFVKFNGHYFDPSYGTDFASIQAWEDASLAGFAALDKWPPQGELVFHRIVIRSNPEGLQVTATEVLPPN